MYADVFGPITVVFSFTFVRSVFQPDTVSPIAKLKAIIGVVHVFLAIVYSKRNEIGITKTAL